MAACCNKKRLTQLREAFLSLSDAAIHFHANQTI